MYIFIVFFVSVLYMYSDVLRRYWSLYARYKNTLDPDGSRGHIHVIWTSLMMIISLLRFYFMASREVGMTPVEKLNHKFLKIPFRYRDQSYFYLLRIPHGIIPVRAITNESGTDVTEEILPYLGPNLDCGHSGVTPADFGYKSLTISTVLDRIAAFEENDPISMSP